MIVFSCLIFSGTNVYVYFFQVGSADAEKKMSEEVKRLNAQMHQMKKENTKLKVSRGHGFWKIW